MAACGKCIWKYIEQVWARTSNCTGTCRCPDTIDEDIDKSTTPQQVRTFSNQSNMVTLASGDTIQGIKNDRFKETLERAVMKNVVVEHRKFASTNDRDDPTKGVLTNLTTVTGVRSAFVASDPTSTFTVSCVEKRNRPGTPQHGMFVIGG